MTTLMMNYYDMLGFFFYNLMPRLMDIDGYSSDCDFVLFYHAFSSWTGRSFFFFFNIFGFFFAQIRSNVCEFRLLFHQESNYYCCLIF